MAKSTVPYNALNGQTLTTPLTIQQRYNLALRRRRDNDSRMAIALREYDALLKEREAIEAEVRAAALCYRDARDAGRLAEQGRAAVEAACEVWGMQ